MKITIKGKQGSGKTLLANFIREKLRELSAKKQLTDEEQALLNCLFCKTLKFRERQTKD